MERCVCKIKNDVSIHFTKSRGSLRLVHNKACMYFDNGKVITLVITLRCDPLVLGWLNSFWKSFGIFWITLLEFQPSRLATEIKCVSLTWAFFTVWSDSLSLSQGYNFLQCLCERMHAICWLHQYQVGQQQRQTWQVLLSGTVYPVLLHHDN